MFALLSPKLWLALALAGVLAFTHVAVYRSGKAAVRVQWDKERAETTAEALVASEARRVKGELLTATNTKVINDYNTQKTQSAAAAVVNAGKLRDLQTSLDRARSQQAPAVSGAVADPRLDIIAECSSAVGKLDDKVKSLAGTLTGLQAYVSGVCLSPQ